MWQETRASAVDIAGQPKADENEPTPTGMGEGSKNSQGTQSSSPSAVKVQKFPLCPDTHGEEKDNRKCKTPGMTERLLQKDNLTKGFKMESN